MDTPEKHLGPVPAIGTREGDCGTSITVAFIDLISNFQGVMFEMYAHTHTLTNVYAMLKVMITLTLVCFRLVSASMSNIY